MNSETDTTSIKEAEAEANAPCPMGILARGSMQSYRDYSEERAERNKSIRHFMKGILFYTSDNGTPYEDGRSKWKNERYKAHKLLTHQRKAKKRRA